MSTWQEIAGEFGYGKLGIENGYHVQRMSEEIDQLRARCEGLTVAIKNELKNGCACGFEESCGEGYTDGVCFLHEALAKWGKE